MRRRELVMAGGAAAAAQMVGTAIAGCGAQAPVAGGTATPAAAPGDATAAWAEASAECLAKGEICLAHCIRLLSDGDQSMAECAKAVHAMLAICRAVGPIAAADSEHAAALAAICHAVCTSCAAACEPHSHHHAECAACFTACRASITAAEAVLA